MLIGQVLSSFAVWILFGWLQARRAGKWRDSLARLSRPLRTALGPLLMIGGAGVLLGGAALIAAIRGLTATSLTLAGWLIVTLVGIIFVAAQIVASLMMVSLAVQNEPARIPETSDARINGRNSNESKSSARP